MSPSSVASSVASSSSVASPRPAPSPPGFGFAADPDDALASTASLSAADLAAAFAQDVAAGAMSAAEIQRRADLYVAEGQLPVDRLHSHLLQAKWFAEGQEPNIVTCTALWGSAWTPQRETVCQAVFSKFLLLVPLLNRVQRARSESLDRDNSVLQAVCIDLDTPVAFACKAEAALMWVMQRRLLAFQTMADIAAATSISVQNPETAICVFVGVQQGIVCVLVDILNPHSFFANIITGNEPAPAA